jgi:trimeric autotransporter adhesin
VRVVGIAALVLANVVIFAQTQKPGTGGVIQGIVQSGGALIPGVTVTATNFITDEKVSTSTDPNGQYQLTLPKTGAYGAYIVETSMPAFAPGIKEADIKDPSQPERLDFELMLLSRSQQASANRAPSVGLRERGAQTLPVTQQATNDTSDHLTSGDLSTAGIAPDAPTESVAVLGNTAQTTFGNNFDFDRERIQQFIDERFGEGPPIPGPGDRGRFPGGRVGDRGGGRGAGGGFAIGARGGFNVNRPRGNISYTRGDSAFDASPYSLTGQPAAKPEYSQNRLSATIGGPLKIPKLIVSTNTNYTFTYNGTRLRNPYDAFSTVPTLAERRGDFSQTLSGTGSGSPVQVLDPATHLPFVNNTIPAPMINPAAARLLTFIPQPNLPGDVQNFHYVTAVTNKSDDINLRFNHTFGDVIGFLQGGRRGGRGGRSGGDAARRGSGPRPTNLNFGLQYHSSENRLSNPFPSVGGTNAAKGLNTTVGLVHSFGRLTDNLRVNYNVNRASSTNLYAFQQDIVGLVGVTGVSRVPFDWGIPNLAFTNFTGLSDVRPSLRRDQTVQIQNGMIWNRGRHALRWGGDFRWIQSNLQTDQNARGSFTFTGARTAATSQGAAVQGIGFDFADFLLGLPQLTSVQYGGGKYYFRGTSWDLFFQDDWRLRGNLTLNLGLRYEYISPTRELNNRIVNLDVAPGFTAVAPAFPGQAGPFTGVFPLGLIEPDRNNFAPRVGIAWRATNRTILRVGYGINYNTGAYGNLVQQLAFQPPFSVTQTNINSAFQPLTLQNGFPSPPPATVTNNFGVDRNYRLGYAQMWNLDVQREFRSANLTLNLDYTGTKGTRLDVIEAPNRTATSLRIPGVQPFSWETSAANSTGHAATIRLRRRLQAGVQIGGSYTFSKSIDNASSIGSSGGASGGVVAQNAFDLAAERGLSNFDQTHRLNLDYLLDLPFGREKRFLANVPYLRGALADWQLNGGWSLVSGLPYTARVLGSFTDVNRGTNGTLRAKATGVSADLPHPTVAEWFNTAAFTVPPAGQFGNIGRNTLRGPTTSVFNMSLNKTIPFADGRTIELRAQASNIFNTPQFGTIDTNLNSASFGRVTSVGSMRKIQLVARFRF